MGVTINKKSTTTEPPLKNGQQPKPPGGLNAFYWYQIFTLDSADVEVQEMFSSHGGHLTLFLSESLTLVSYRRSLTNATLIGSSVSYLSK